MKTGDNFVYSGDRFEDFAAPLFIAWQINSACNLGCLHCCEEAGLSFPDEMNREEALDFCRQIVELNIPYTALSGGEPLMHPNFFEICESLRSHGVSLKVETNGEFIDEGIAKKFAKLGMRSVQISLDGATAASHEKLRLSGDWGKAVNACKLLIKEGVNTEIVFVPTKFNISETGELIDLARSLGVYGVYTGKIMQIGRAAENWDLLCPSDSDYDKFFQVLKAKTEEYKGKMKVYYYPDDVVEELKYRLEYPSASLLVIPDGKVKLIGPLPFICGNLRKDSLKEVWEKYKKAWRLPEVVDYTKRVIKDHQLLSEANKWVELSL